MPTHERKAIRDAVVAALSGETVAETRVISTREAPFRNGSLPSISVYVVNETVDEATRAPRELKRTAVIAVDGWLSSGADDVLDDALDAFALEIETAMDADRFLNVTASDSILLSTEMLARTEGNKPIGVVHMEYAVTYYTNERLAAATDKFNTADVRISLEGEQAEDDQTHTLKTGINQEP